MPIPNSGMLNQVPAFMKIHLVLCLLPFLLEIKLRELGIGSFLVETKRSPFLTDISALPPHYLFHVYREGVDGFRSCGSEDSGDEAS